MNSNSLARGASSLVAVVIPLIVITVFEIDLSGFHKPPVVHVDTKEYKDALTFLTGYSQMLATISVSIVAGCGYLLPKVVVDRPVTAILSALLTVSGAIMSVYLGVYLMELAAFDLTNMRENMAFLTSVLNDQAIWVLVSTSGILGLVSGAWK